jgi:hypothetical protein
MTDLPGLFATDSMAVVASRKTTPAPLGRRLAKPDERHLDYRKN